jgi:hypothetical protein
VTKIVEESGCNRRASVGFVIGICSFQCLSTTPISFRAVWKTPRLCANLV